MNDLGKRVSGFCDRHFGGLKAACKAADLKYTTLHAQISHNREIPFSTIERLCSTAGVSLEAMRSEKAEIGIAAPVSSHELHRKAAAAYSQALREVQDAMRRAGSDILVDDVLNWLHRNGGRLTDFDAIRHRVDLFYHMSPDDNVMRPHRIGPESLAARCFAISSEEQYDAKVQQLGRSVIDNSVAAHLSVQKTQRYQVEDIRLHAVVDGCDHNLKYRRVMAPVTALDGSAYTLVFAQLL